MGELFLVRHAQAAFGTDDYDRLTRLGHQQAEWLGNYFVERDMHFDRVVCGSLRRHRETLDGIGSAGVQLAAPRLDPRLDEYDPARLVAAHLAALQRTRDEPAGETTGRAMLPRPAIQISGAEPMEHKGQAEPVGVVPLHGPEADRKVHFRMLRDALTAWTLDELDLESHRSFRVFQDGAYQAFQLACGADQVPPTRALVVTSGGPLSSILAHHLGMPASSFIALNLQVRNSGFCEFRLNERGAHLVSFNNVPHLDTPDRRRNITFS